MKTRKSILIPTRISFENKSAKDQAVEILEYVLQYYNEGRGYEQIGILYSANAGQTDTIRQTYENGGWFTGTNGGNQASVISEVEKLLRDNPRYQKLQSIFRIIPITTMDYSKSGHVMDDQRIKDDLNAVSVFLKKGNRVVLGWQNEYTKEGEYAIGGGIAMQSGTKEEKMKKQIQMDAVQIGLSDIAEEYPSSSTTKINMTVTIDPSSNDHQK